MEIFDLIWTNGAAFLFILTVIVFFHELGHYYVARWNGVRVDVFSIGFGPELFGWNDRSGTRWKVSLLPLGGYVKMFGESDESNGDDRGLTPQERAVSFHYKSVGQRVAIVSAGPVANFVLAIVVLTGLFATTGEPFTPAEIGAVQPGSAAEAAGFRPGDRFTAIGGARIERFEDVQRVVRSSPGQELVVTVRRGDETMDIRVVPERQELVDRFGNRSEIGLLGVSRTGNEFVRHDPLTAAVRAVAETWEISLYTLRAVGQIIAGTRGSDELGGPVRIAQMSGQVAEIGIASVFWFLAVLSINLGLINLFPVPMLDGGHLLFYGIEALRGRPASDRVMEISFRVGLGLVVALFLFVTVQDLMRFEGIANFIEDLAG
ncbi:MAG TPA: RIP metalloprotease RseP [Alphaproteobacteria bacterium]|jgi:regulator of sigma E protease